MGKLSELSLLLLLLLLLLLRFSALNFLFSCSKIDTRWTMLITSLYKGVEEIGARKDVYCLGIDTPLAVRY